MLSSALARELYEPIRQIPLIDPHSHINPLAPTSKSLDDILGYHYYTELAHSAGMSQEPLAASFEPRERVRAILSHMDRFDNTAQYSWFREIARTFLGFTGTTLTAADTDWLYDSASKLFAQPDWETQVLTKSGLEKIFLTNEFDDQLTGFDTNRYVPCLRTDTLVFNWRTPEVQARLFKMTGVDAREPNGLKEAITRIFTHFLRHGAKAAAISLPPFFTPSSSADEYSPEHVFWLIAEHCRDFRMPFDLMIGVNRRVYRNGVYQGQDLFDQRTSLIQYAQLFNAFPEVTFCVSVLTSNQNQELASYSWIFPNVVTSGHWWYANIPAYITHDLRARLQAVPKIKQIGYYSDMYKLEFGLPKFNMYRQLLANVLADDYVRTGWLTAEQAVDLARVLLRENVQRIFRV
jgi:glucuronate isomerase